MKVELRHNPKDNFLGVQTTEDLNRIIDEGKFPELVMLSEAYSDKRIVQAAFHIKVSRRRLILIAGPSSSGKTTFAKKLTIQLRVEGLEPLYLSTDDYFLEREDTPLDPNGEKNYEDLSAVDLDLFNQNLEDLLAGKEVDLPTFNFITGHKEFGKRITKLEKHQPIVLEGIHALNDELTPRIPRLQKFKIFICPITAMHDSGNNEISNEDQRILRRMSRDYMTRGHSPQDTIRDWPKVRAGEERNIYPFAKNVELYFNSSHIYEIPVLKGKVEPVLKKVKKREPEYEMAQRLLKFLEGFKEYANDEDIVPNDSILKEFIGGSVYTE